MVEPEQRIEVLTDLVQHLAAKAEHARARLPADIEDVVLALVDKTIGRALEEWAPNGREAKVAKSLHTELRLEIRAHFAE